MEWQRDTDGGWMRWRAGGFGIAWQRASIPPPFSVRIGLRRTVTLAGWRVHWLKPFPAPPQEDRETLSARRSDP